jgi:hypothetical protein
MMQVSNPLNAMTRRGNGEGSIIRRTDDRWCVVVSLEGGRQKFI